MLAETASCIQTRQQQLWGLLRVRYMGGSQLGGLLLQDNHTATRHTACASPSPQGTTASMAGQKKAASLLLCILIAKDIVKTLKERKTFDRKFKLITFPKMPIGNISHLCTWNSSQ